MVLCHVFYRKALVSCLKGFPTAKFLQLLRSQNGTQRTWRDARLESAMRTKAGVGQRLQKNRRGQESELRETRH
jgi:hypothetical protein